MFSVKNQGVIKYKLFIWKFSIIIQMVILEGIFLFIVKSEDNV